MIELDIDEIADRLVYVEIDHDIHTTNIIGEDEDYYYTVPINNIKRTPKTEVHFDIKELVKQNTIYRLERNINLSNHRRRELIDEVLEELKITHAELFI